MRYYAERSSEQQKKSQGRAAAQKASPHSGYNSERNSFLNQQSGRRYYAERSSEL